ncbi:L,D-transpeptidase family protein [Desmospora profundinema]|uniref:L,D-TPase catalytic domain-containing protein n=1 Tax=Desmospora profundinema TaxID=1571184 RepID=A0ABU1IH01_9BACL|nr:L,D-transpeptidase family protein [Desmospora profundinema]MDR6224053.1 hypothetical protein [Desmospora profundinema]
MKSWVFLCIIITALFQPFHIQGIQAPPPRIQIDLWEHRLYVIQGSEVIVSYPVAVGKDQCPTPIGEWKVVHMSSDWGGGFGPRWMGLNVPWGQYGIHGTNRPYSIGRNASHGYVRMKNSDVKDLYRMISIGTPVKIVGPIMGRDEYRPKRLVRGDRGSLVLLIQNRLHAAKYYQGTQDGIYGFDLEQAIKRYQKDHQLERTGQIRMEEYIRLGLIE